MSRSRYDLMKNSNSPNSVDANGLPWKDPLTIQLNKFRFTKTPIQAIISSADINRMDIFIYNLYSISELDDVILWLNGVPSADDLFVGENISVPNFDELNAYYSQYAQG